MRRLYGDLNSAFTEQTEEHAAKHGSLVVDDEGVVRFQTAGEVEAQSASGQEETGAAVEATGDAPEGSRAQHEEVGTPEAPAAG